MERVYKIEQEPAYFIVSLLISRERLKSERYYLLKRDIEIRH